MSGISHFLVLEERDDYFGGNETLLLKDVRWRLTIEDTSYTLQADCFITPSRSYEAEQWGFWEITDAAAGIVRFSPQQIEEIIVWEYNNQREIQTRNVMNLSWTGIADINDSNLLLTNLPALFDIKADTLNLSREAE